MKNLATLYKESTSGDHERKKEGRTLGIKVSKSKVTPFVTQIKNRTTLGISTNFNVQGVTDKYETQVIVFPSIKASIINSDAMVYCSCPHFKFRYAYVLKSAESLIERPELGAALTLSPDKTNPNNTESLCKHLLATVEYLKVKSKSIKDVLLVN